MNSDEPTNWDDPPNYYCKNSLWRMPLIRCNGCGKKSDISVEKESWHSKNYRLCCIRKKCKRYFNMIRYCSGCHIDYLQNMTSMCPKCGAHGVERDLMKILDSYSVLEQKPWMKEGKHLKDR